MVSLPSPSLSIQEAEFCYDDASKGSQEILHDCTFREGLTLAVSYFTSWIGPTANVGKGAVARHTLLYFFSSRESRRTLPD